MRGGEDKGFFFVNPEPREERESTNDREGGVDMRDVVRSNREIVSKSIVPDMWETREGVEEGIIGEDKEKGGEGTPCLTPLSISTQDEVCLPKNGDTLTSLRAPLTK